MGLVFEEVRQGGNYFKPAEAEAAVAILFEVVSFDRQAPSKWGPKDGVTCNVTVFNNQAALEAGTPSDEFRMTQIQNAAIVSNLKGLVGKATVGKMTKLPPRDGNQAAWAIAKVSADVQAQVVEYANKREAAKQAALDSAPSFD